MFYPMEQVVCHTIFLHEKIIAVEEREVERGTEFTGHRFDSPSLMAL